MVRLVTATALCLVLASACVPGQDTAEPEVTETATSATDTSAPTVEDFTGSRTTAPIDPSEPVDLNP